MLKEAVKITKYWMQTLKAQLQITGTCQSSQTWQRNWEAMGLLNLSSVSRGQGWQRLQSWEVFLIISYLSCCYDGFPDKSNLRKEGLIVAPVWRCLPSCWGQEEEAAGHKTSRQGHREVDAGTQLASSFSFSRASQPTGWLCQHLGWIFTCSPHLENPSQVCPEGCLHGDIKSHLVSSED